MSDNVIELTYEDDTAIISINNPPVNSLGISVRKGLVDAIKSSENNSSVRSIIITGNGSTFPAGADIKEFGHPPQAPHLPEVCEEIENINKPVIAALHGTALGGGLEIALASNYRIVEEKTKLGLPEVHLGLLPGAGGTQRLPRLVGISAALQIMTSGKSISASEALKLGIVDKISTNLLEDAKAFAKKVAEKNTHPKTSMLTEKFDNDELNKKAIASMKELIQQTFGALEAPKKILECVEASVSMDISEGLKYERKSFSELMAVKQSKA